jgi:hypothetical protein
MRHIKALVHTIQKIKVRLKFLWSRYKLHSQKVWYPEKVLSQKTLKYESPSIMSTSKFSWGKSNTKVKVAGSKFFICTERSWYKNTLMKYQSPIPYHSKDIGKVKVCIKFVKHQGKTCWFPWKGLVIRNTCNVIYQSPSTYL